MPDDRTVFYGLFLRHMSLGVSPWLVIVAQGVLVAWTMYGVMGIFMDDRKRRSIFLPMVILLTLGTGISYNVSILIPDIFTGMGILAFLFILLRRNASTVSLALAVLIMVYAMMAHLSNLALQLVLMLMVLLYTGVRWFRKQSLPFTRNRILLALSTVVSALVLVPVLQNALGDKFQYSGIGHVMAVNKLMEVGILETFLDNECGDGRYKMCEFKDEFGHDFLWDPQSPLYKTGGWAANRDEFEKLLADVYSRPELLSILLRKSIEYTVVQFFSFDVERPQQYKQGSSPHHRISERFPDTIREYQRSLQHNGFFDPDRLNSLQRIFVFVSFGIILLLWIHGRMDPILKQGMILLLIALIMNAMICSNLSTIDFRFQNRVIWLVPFAAAVSIGQALDLLGPRRKITHEKAH